MRNSERDELDSIVDGALTRYAAAEPLAGIEQRVLHRVRSANARRQGSKILGWVVACPILLAPFLIVLARWIPVVRPPAEMISASLPHVGPPSNAFTILRKSVPGSRRGVRPSSVHPAISGEERTLLALAQSPDAESAQFFAEIQRGDEPLAVPEIEIAPLQIPEVP